MGTTAVGHSKSPSPQPSPGVRGEGAGWAAHFPRDALTAALPLRLRPGVEAHAAGDVVWLRGPTTDDDLTAALRHVPGVERFAVAADELTPVGRRLPVGPVPAGPWMPYAEFARLRLPPAALPAAVSVRVAVRLVPATIERDPDALLIPLPALATWAVTAPAARLDRLRYAARSDGTALVIGRPLPPLAGEPLVDHGGLLVPAGLAWHPPVDPATLRLAMDVPAGTLALFDPDGTHERIPLESIVAVTRAAMRKLF